MLWCDFILRGGLLVLQGVLGKFGVWVWCFCGQDVVDSVGKVVCGRTNFGGCGLCRICGFILRLWLWDEGIPQGLKPPVFWLWERAQGYLEAIAMALQLPCRLQLQLQRQRQKQNAGILHFVQDDDKNSSIANGYVWAKATATAKGDPLRG
jgi:hypothetical protein